MHIPHHGIANSPKRKRGAWDPSVAVAPCPSRLKTTDLPTIPVAKAAEDSPNVAGRLQNLELAERERPNLSRLNGDRSSNSQISWAERTINAATFEPIIILPSQHCPYPTTPPASSYGPQYRPPWHAWSETRQQPSATTPPLEIPETPLISSTSTPTPPTSAAKLKEPSPSNPTLWWSDTEITGHNPDPTDPMDDGEGINGVGFIPTPAMATARAEKRRRQIKEWKDREGREARARRGERRRKRDAGEEDSAAIGSRFVESGETEGRRVRFVES